jgi:hypothetical protein
MCRERKERTARLDNLGYVYEHKMLIIRLKSSTELFRLATLVSIFAFHQTPPKQMM